MSGRGNGKGGGSEQESNRQKSGRDSDKQTTKKVWEDHTYYVGLAKQSSDFETTTEFFINHVKDWDYGADISKALKQRKDFDFSSLVPKLRVSRKEDAAKKAAEDRQYERMFDADYNRHQNREEKYQENKVQAYGKLWERCSKGLKQKIEQRKDFEDTIEDDPFELLKAIKEYAMSYQENRYSVTIVHDALKSMLECKQKENESLIDYAKRFKSARDILESQIGGPIQFTKMMAEGKETSEAAFEKYMAYLIILNADWSKYGSLLNGLNAQYSLGNVQYPETVNKSINVMSNHKFDKKPKDKKKNDKVKEEKDADNEDEGVKMSFANLEGACYCCGKQGHKLPQCQFKDKPKEEWAINKAKVNEEQSHANIAGENTDSNASSAWCGAQLKTTQKFNDKEDTKDWILLDTGSTATIFCNKNLVTNIRAADESINISTNGGMMTSNLKANLPAWGEVWFSPSGMINVFNFGEMARRYKITYDHKQSAFTVHLPHKAVKFVNNGNDLYIFKPTMRTKAQYQFVHLAKDKTPKGLNVKTREGVKFDDAAWIAGVSHEISVNEDNEPVKGKDEEQDELVKKEKGVAMEAIIGKPEPPKESKESNEESAFYKEGTKSNGKVDAAFYKEDIKDEDEIVKDDDEEPIEYGAEEAIDNEEADVNQDDKEAKEEVNPSIVEEAKAKWTQRFARTSSLKNGLKALGEQGRNVAWNAMQKLGKPKEGMTPKPTRVEELTTIEKKEATAVTQRPELQPVLLAGVTNGKHGGDIMSTDIPGKEVIMKISGIHVEDEKFVLKIEVCPTHDMITNYVKEPADGTVFYKFRKKKVNAEGDGQCEDSRSVLENEIRPRKSTRCEYQESTYTAEKRETDVEVKSERKSTNRLFVEEKEKMRSRCNDEHRAHFCERLLGSIGSSLVIRKRIIVNLSIACRDPKRIRLRFNR